MNYEQIKRAAFEDELQKIAKNQVAAYAIKGGTLGAGVGGIVAGGTTHLVVNKLLKAIKDNVPKHFGVASKAATPIKILATIGGAVGGSEIGGRVGAYVGGGIRGTTRME